jgi:integrase
MSLKVSARGNVLYIQGTLLGKRVRMSTGLPRHRRKEADVVRIQTESAILRGGALPNERRCFEDFIGAYSKSLSVSRNAVPGTEDRVLALLKLHCGGVNVDRLTIRYMSQHIVRRWDHLQDNSRRRYINVLNAVINHGNREFASHVPTYPNKSIRDERSVHFNEDEAKKFLAAVRGDVNYMNFMYLVYLGVRLGELRLMQLDRPNNNVFVYCPSRHTKTIDRVLPIPDNLGWAIDREGFDPMGAYTSDNRASADMNKTMKRVTKAMGIGDRGMRVHDLRHTFAYLTAQNGADLAELQGLLGHKDIRMTMRYRGFIPSKARDAVAGLLTT